MSSLTIRSSCWLDGAGPTGLFDDTHDRWHERRAKELGTADTDWSHAVESMRDESWLVPLVDPLPDATKERPLVAPRRGRRMILAAVS